MAVKSKRLRFQILNRDDFTCQYCGRKPPEVELHVDHILPVKEGGTDAVENLVAACADCNLGKAAKLLTAKIPPSPVLAERIEELVEREQQLRDHAAALRTMHDTVDVQVGEAQSYWTSLWAHVGTLEKTDYPYRKVVAHYVETIGLAEVKDAMDVVRSKWTNIVPAAIHYLNAVMRNKEAEKEGRLVWCISCATPIALNPGENTTIERWCKVCQSCYDETVLAQRAREAERLREEKVYAEERRREHYANIESVDALLEATAYPQEEDEDYKDDITIEVEAWDSLAEAAGF